MLGDTPANRRLIGKYIEVYDYPDGRIELRANDYVLPYVRYDRLPDVDQGTIVENKRLGHVLKIAQLVQQQRDNRRSHSAPARTNLGLPVEKAKAAPGARCSARSMCKTWSAQLARAFAEAICKLKFRSCRQ